MQNTRNKRSQFRRIGILTCRVEGRYPPFYEQAFYRRLSLAGRRLGCEVVVIFPESLEQSEAETDGEGYVFDEQTLNWRAANMPLPDILYDRCFYANRRQQLDTRHRLEPLLKQHRVSLLGRGLQGKWMVHRLLACDPDITPHLPPTALYRDAREILARAGAGESLFMKPQAGFGGHGAIRIRSLPDGRYQMIGRGPRDRPFIRIYHSARSFKTGLQRLVGGKPYLIQPDLELTDDEGRCFDLRVLMQKNRHGKWSLTGMAIRVGRPGSITSNLHGGGTVREPESYLEKLFGAEPSRMILADIRVLSGRIPPVLESMHGRLAELGLDFGIDKQGRIWLLEANSKPGRTVFHLLHDKTARKDAVINPIGYAQYLLDRQLGG